jgi:hypothetical protein
MTQKTLISVCQDSETEISSKTEKTKILGFLTANTAKK